MQIDWEGMYANKQYSISHLRYWQLMAEELKLTALNVATDHCDERAPNPQYTVDTASYDQPDGRVETTTGYNVYTDGSKMKGHTGAGVHVRLNEDIVLEHSYRLPDDATVFQAEMYAIYEAACAMQWQDEEKDIQFFVDSRAALDALNATSIKSRITLQAVEQLNSLAPSKITLSWIRGHKGTPGNEAADKLAKKGGTLDYIQRLGLPLKELKNDIDDCIRERWDVTWSRYPQARQTKFFYPTQDKARGKEVMEWTRQKLSRYIKVVSGHNNLRYHRSNIDPDIDPMCRFCGEAQESFIHLIEDCPALWQERQDLHGRRGEVLDGEERQEKPDHILQFSYTERIDKALKTQEDDAVQEVDDITDEEDLPLGRTEEEDIDMSSSERSDMDISSADDSD